jgi:hypothetical protein
VRGIVGAWDVATTGITFPPRPEGLPPLGFQCVVRRRGRPVGELEWQSDRVLRTGDRVAARHLLAVASATDVTSWEAGAPLRRQLSWQLSPEVLFVHAAAVGSAEGVALIAGAAGAGKSSTSLACLQAGMGFLSDDYCLLRDDPLVAYRLYSTARVYDDDIARFPGLPAPVITQASIATADPAERPKALYRLHDTLPDRLLASAPVRAVLLPEAGGPVGRLEPVQPADALRRIAPSALRQMSVEPDRDLAGLRKLVTSLPCWRVTLHPDRDANPALIEEALTRAASLQH